MIKIALPNKGQLCDPTLEILTDCGYRVNRSARSLSALDLENGIEFYFLRPGDIPLYISNGILDAGVTGRDFVAEKELQPSWLLDLHFGQSKMCAAVPQESPVQSLAEVAALKIATSFPNITRSYFKGKSLQIVDLEGAVEISIKLGIAEAIVDVVETGSTLRQAGLRIVGEPLFHSVAALYAHPGRETAEEVLILKSRLEGKLVAHQHKMVEYDCPATILDAACAITPGIESPTIMPLQKQGWFSVKSMIQKREAHKIMDDLSRLGCKGILLSSVESARI